MPSKALDFFEKKLLTDVDRLIKTHEDISGGRPGRHHLGHITRSGFVMLCAAWESYIEHVGEEALRKMIERSTSPKDLPKLVQKHVANFVREHKNELKVLELAGDGWVGLFVQVAALDTSKLNTPKSEPIKILFRRLAGVDDIWTDWEDSEVQEIDDFVSLRGEIAHKGSDAKYVKIKELKTHRQKMANIAVAIDNQIANHIVEYFPKPHKSPWRRRGTQ